MPQNASDVTRVTSQPCQVPFASDEVRSTFDQPGACSTKIMMLLKACCRTVASSPPVRSTMIAAIRPNEPTSRMPQTL